MIEAKREVLEKYVSTFQCLDDPSLVKLRGGYGAPSASILAITLKSCQPEINKEVICKSQEEIDEWARAASMAFLHN